MIAHTTLCRRRLHAIQALSLSSWIYTERAPNRKKANFTPFVQLNFFLHNAYAPPPSVARNSFV